jgi:sporulation protein YlmC with PRC-barrel domain
MTEEFTLGAQASCTDGVCGVVSRTILDPSAGTITHLVIEPRHHKDTGRLVPVELIDVNAGKITLRCTLVEFSELNPAEEIEVDDQAMAVPGYTAGGVAASTGALGMPGGMGMGGPDIGTGLAAEAPLLVTHTVPAGETEVERHERVHAVDGEIGQVAGFVVNRDDHAITHVLLKEGHLWGRKEVAIPVSAIVSVADGIQLNMTKKQVEDLPRATVSDP